MPRISSFSYLRSISTAMAASLIFLASVGFPDRYAFFTYCWVIVLAPSTASPIHISTQRARIMPQRSTPPCSRKRSSSLATRASKRLGGILWRSASRRFSPPKIVPITRVDPDVSPTGDEYMYVGREVVAEASFRFSTPLMSPKYPPAAKASTATTQHIEERPAQRKIRVLRLSFLGPPCFLETAGS